MKIDFEHFKLTKLSGKEQIADVREVIAEAIYANTGSLKFKLLAEKIYKSSGETDYTEEEVHFLRLFIEPDMEVVSSKLKDAISKIINNQ